MKETKAILAEQEDKLAKTTAQFETINKGIKTSVDETSAIKIMTDDCNQSKLNIIKAMRSLSTISQDNAATSQETTATMQELNATISLLAEEANKLNNLSSNLERKVQVFKL